MADDLPLYKAWLLGHPCRVFPCIAAVMVHHHTKERTYPPWARPPKALDGTRGRGQRASDWYGFTLCFHDHNDLHNKKGHFEGWTQERLLAWQDEQVAAMHALFEEEVTRNPRSPLALMRSQPWEPPADKARERRERKKKRGMRRGRLNAAIEEYQHVVADAVVQLSPDGAAEIANRERWAAVEWLRQRAGERPAMPAGFFQEFSEIVDELDEITEPLSLPRTA